ncbi:YvrJ family protein [Proteocatella sphenisci]
MDVLFQNILEQGFPVVISVYLLVRLEGKLDQLESTLTDLKIEISKLSIR